jgi:2-polyprenyl-3-methyl-5-hydroxy-6-metoxy-1,4-benzoquinol methylase
MRLRILDWLVCPNCGDDLSLRDAQWFSDTPPDQPEIRTGLLSCRRGHHYAIQDGVPRLLAQAQATAPPASDDAQAISASFSREWGHFQYNDRTWMEVVDDRCSLFLKELNCSPDDLNGKVILDAGCGNASLSMGVMKRFNAEVLAADVSQSVINAYQYFLPQDPGNTHFAQADLMNHPFRKSSFDVIYSSGVLHHNRNTRQALQSISSSLKPGGRIYIWLYEKQPGLAHQLKQVLRSIIAPLPAPIKHALIAAWLPQSMLRQSLRYHLKGHRPQDRLKWRERMILLMDHYTPRYRWEHTPAEVHAWFRELGFDHIQTTETRDYGFGVAATKPAPTPAHHTPLHFQSLAPA